VSLPEQTLPAAVGPAGPGPQRGARRSTSWRAAGLHLGSLLLGGVVLGLAWRALVPVLAGASDGVERQVAGEVAMAGLGLLAGVLVAVIGLLRSGPGAPTRFGLSLLGSALGSLVAWRVGLIAGAPPVAITGVLVVWPFVLALVTVLVTLLTTLTSSDTYE